MSRRALVVANWKMHKLGQEVRAFGRELSQRLAASPARSEIWVAPPAVFVGVLAADLAGSGVGVAGQDCHEAAAGAFTGEVAADMLRDAGACAVIVGHSERRRLYGETDARVRAKLEAVAAARLIPILCVGETAEERSAGATLAVTEAQLRLATADLDRCLEPGRLVIAYEPVWAIGTGLTATADDAEEVCAFLRRALEAAHGKGWAEATRILYGGSVSVDNAGKVIADPNVDGFLVGGASLDVKSFEAIVRASD